MERWFGRVAVITGASTGIGAAIAYQLQDHGLHVVALARRVDKIQGAVEKAREDAKSRNRYHGTKVAPGKLYPKKCDVQKEEDIISIFKWVKETFGKVDILVNNAGVLGEGPLSDAATEDWLRILNTNVVGLCIATREAVRLMKEKNVDDGHIVHMNSISGHSAPVAGANMDMYWASKHAVTCLTESLRKDFLIQKTNRKVTSVSPGAVDTDMINQAKIKTPALQSIPLLHSEDVADAVTFAISTPPHVQIHEIIIKPVGEKFA